MIEEVKNAVLKGKRKTIESIICTALDNGASASEILASMTAAMDEIGIGFQNNEIYVPEMLVAATTMQKGVDVVRPLLAAGEIGGLGKVVIGTVYGDLHDIGKNLVKLMIESAGFEIVDLGVNVPPASFVEAVKNDPEIKIVACSALLTTTMDSMRETVKLLADAGLRDRVKVMVGGAPITQAFCDEIGADIYTVDAASAAEAAKAAVA